MGLKSKLIPESWKTNIDNILKQELLFANRYFAQSNPDLSKLIRKEAEINPLDFNSRLVQRWNWHNYFYEELLEPALSLLLTEDHFALTPKKVANMIKVYKTSSIVDQATLIPSAAIKKHVEIWADSLSKKMMLNEEERLMLLTIPKESFSVKYRQEHLNYLIAEREGNQQKIKLIKSKLKRKYHGDDETIFNSRLDKIKSSSKDLSKLEETISELSIPYSYKVKHFYFTLERPLAKALIDTLTVDNCDEYETLYSLKGISGFILRKMILKHLNDSKLLKNSGAIYEFSDETILDSLESLRKYRKEVMFKKVSPYTQTDLTCGAACLMMATKYFGLGKTCKDTEMRIHNFSKSAFLPGEHFSGLALYAANNGLETKLLHSEKTMFKFNDSLFDKETFDKLMREYRGFLGKEQELSIKVENGTKINPLKIKNFLDEDYLVLVAGKYGHILHSILAIGYNSQGIVSIDPLEGKRKVLNNHSLDYFMETPIGSWMLAIRPNQSPLQNLLKRLGEYEENGKEYIQGDIK